MSIPGLLVSMAFILGGIAWIVLPFLNPTAVKKTSSNSLIRDEHGQLTRRYSDVLTTIRELDADHSTGKIQPDDYERERQRWTQEGVQLLRKIDQ